MINFHIKPVKLLLKQQDEGSFFMLSLAVQTCWTVINKKKNTIAKKKKGQTEFDSYCKFLTLNKNKTVLTIRNFRAKRSSQTLWTWGAFTLSLSSFFILPDTDVVCCTLSLCYLSPAMIMLFSPSISISCLLPPLPVSPPLLLWTSHRVICLFRWDCKL